MRKLDVLYRRVTVAIREMEKAERKVSFLEEEIAKLTRASSDEGRIARRGAVRSAMISGDAGRATALVMRFLAEDEIDAALRKQLMALLS